MRRGHSDGAIYFNYPKTMVLFLIKLHLIIVSNHDAGNIFLACLPLVVLEGAVRSVPWVDEEVAVLRILMHVVGVVVILVLMLFVLSHLVFFLHQLRGVRFIFGG